MESLWKLSVEAIHAARMTARDKTFALRGQCFEGGETNGHTLVDAWSY